MGQVAQDAPPPHPKGRNKSSPLKDTLEIPLWPSSKIMKVWMDLIVEPMVFLETMFVQAQR